MAAIDVPPPIKINVVGVGVAWAIRVGVGVATWSIPGVGVGKHIDGEDPGIIYVGVGDGQSYIHTKISGPN